MIKNEKAIQLLKQINNYSFLWVNYFFDISQILSQNIPLLLIIQFQVLELIVNSLSYKYTAQSFAEGS